MSKKLHTTQLRTKVSDRSLKMHSNKTKKIALLPEVHPSTISRELKRNTAQRGRTAGIYKAENALRKTEMRHRSKRKHILLTEPENRYLPETGA